ncbi:MAG: adenylate/guanylate cyclase domain-containing protein [Actinomycetota bacterium]|nr:adenylate/guanylate cyclase domain-containing protein [Actinomycetota bacterium]
MEPLTPDELAVATGVGRDVIDELVQLDMLPPLGDDGRFPGSSVSRVRLVVSLESSGISLPAIAEAIEAGAFSLGFIDLLSPATAMLLNRSHAEVIAELHMEPEIAAAGRATLGTSSLADDAPIREDDAEVLALLARASALGASGEYLASVIRSIADSSRRLVATQRDFVDEAVIAPLVAGGMTEHEAVVASAVARREYRQIGLRIVNLLMDRFVEDAIFQSLVQEAERALAAAGVVRAKPQVPPAVVFVDIAGYTRLAEEQGDHAAARLATEFAGLVSHGTADHRGRLVKLLGDGAMLQFPDAPSAVRGAIDLVERAKQTGLPPLHVGVDAGAVVRRDGDIFGTVVNVASRLAGAADGGEVLVTDRVVREVDDTDGVEFRSRGATSLKNVREPVELSLVVRAPSAAPGRPA